MVIVSPLSRESTVGSLEATVFREIKNLIPYISVVFAFNVKFLFQHRALLINELRDLFFMDIDFCKPKVIQGLDLTCRDT